MEREEGEGFLQETLPLPGNVGADLTVTTPPLKEILSGPKGQKTGEQREQCGPATASPQHTL